MPTDETIALLKGLRVSDRRNVWNWPIIIGGNWRPVAEVGAIDQGLSPDDAASALVTAAHEWATWAGVIEAAKAYHAAESAYADTWKRCYSDPTPADENTYVIEDRQWHERRDAHAALMGSITAALKEGSDE